MIYDFYFLKRSKGVFTPAYFKLSYSKVILEIWYHLERNPKKDRKHKKHKKYKRGKCMFRSGLSEEWGRLGLSGV